MSKIGIIFHMKVLVIDVGGTHVKVVATGISTPTKIGSVDFDFTKSLVNPVRMLNDAAMQTLGSYQGGRMLFLGLGTGLGAAMILDGITVSWRLLTCRTRTNKPTKSM